MRKYVGPAIINASKSIILKCGIMDWKDKLEKIRAKIAEKDKILVAFSGGVDSSLLAKIGRGYFG